MASTMQAYSSYPHLPHPSRDDMDCLFQLCRTDDWKEVLRGVRANPLLAATPMIMDNHISTTVMHQAITSKGDTSLRAEVISTILRNTPEAAAIKNGYGSLPLHVIAQRNTKMDANTKETLIFQLVEADRSALVEEGGVGKRTPLHIIFTDYISPHLTRMMIKSGSQACFMRDKKGYLPAHVACSRHCSPEKLNMLLSVHPQSLHEKSNDGHTLLSLATSTATKSHPNYALIDELNRQLYASQMRQNHPAYPPVPHHPHHGHNHTMEVVAAAATNVHLYASPTAISTEGDSDEACSRGRLNSNDSNKLSWQPPHHPLATTVGVGAHRSSRRRPRKRRKTMHIEHDTPAAALLLNFSRSGSPRTSLEHESPHQYAQV